MNTNNKVAKWLYTLGQIIIVVGIVAGLIIASSSLYFSWSAFFIYAVSGLISGIMFIGFGEIIRLLENTGNTIVKLDSKVEKIEREIHK
ncbi:hypothetical protein [Lentibacillus salicampi]|uniref:Uncharacterized protein n=1 Tax=Lentibacillus salicampi TaxID=175306 RepID=A0A4Y9AFB0_9BACI|nr:hypothetical protein [Lentibacillus salicampi]TFJ93650.1 hypothetical protein E4U82_06750 [Lentibacillus salicampi]